MVELGEVKVRRHAGSVLGGVKRHAPLSHLSHTHLSQPDVFLQGIETQRACLSSRACPWHWMETS